MVDKVIVSNARALKAKYGKSGFDLVKTAVKDLITADARRGLQTRLVFIDDAAAMRRLGASPSPEASDERGAKQAVDAITSALSPDYIALLDGPDVVPLITLRNHIDGDGFPKPQPIPSDLPYASSGRFSREVHHYLKVTRVVGRIPNVPGAEDPGNLIKCLKTSARAKPRSADNYRSYFGLSAQSFRRSALETIKAIFRTGNQLSFAPPAGSSNLANQFYKLSHFINCHGFPAKPEFYGQKAKAGKPIGDLTVAMSSGQVASHVVEGTVVAAQVCYGAQLYDPKLANSSDPICMAYLAHGALGFLGSTNVSYGWDEFHTPEGGPTKADLLVLFFFERVLAGASLGRSLTEARQRFISTQAMYDPFNLKTLAQFVLLGDPSTTPCIAPPRRSATRGVAVDLDGQDDVTAQRKARRVALASLGYSIAEGKAVPAGFGSMPANVLKRVRTIARERGFENAQEAVFSIGGSKSYRAARQARYLDEQVMIISSRSEATAARVAFRHLVVYIVGNGIARVDETVSR